MNELKGNGNSLFERSDQPAPRKVAKPDDVFPLVLYHIAAGIGLPLKPSMILIRWPVVIVCAYLLIFPAAQYLPVAFFQAFIALYIASNVALYFVSDQRFLSWGFYYPLVITDTIVLTLSLIINGRAETDFYLTFFSLIVVSCIIENARLRAAVTLSAPFIYIGLVYRSAETIDPSVYLRLPFLFVVSLFYGYFTQFIRTDRALRKDAEKRNEGRREMLNIVSHELRTPLNVIGGYAEALKNGTFGNVTHEQELAVSKILTQSANLLHLVNSVLDVSRIEAGQMSLESQEIKLPEYLEELRRHYDMPIKKPVTLRWSFAADLPTIHSDGGKLTIILHNLINNAVKFTEQGTVHVTARQTDDKGGVEFEIADTGVGIAKESLAIIFDKFRQADASSTREYGGVGLGLYIASAFTELLGGSIDVQSEPDHGSVFRVILPA